MHEGRFQIVYILDATSVTIAVYAVLEDGELLNSEEYRIDA